MDFLSRRYDVAKVNRPRIESNRSESKYVGVELGVRRVTYSSPVPGSSASSAS
jgi:hypothetical protein